ncbi:ArsR/SmtB family transcription factor [Streptomyces sp. Go40/10]|uniref:ArsR/SmtB family transcription factor n=1 Tax=Streptomyces sp. Go40/10 TaxID=2825844 RepID=UPI002738B6D6|nr:winged helix-turn-helix domain-containing protein [Streptomyces sp. Go40/10]
MQRIHFTPADFARVRLRTSAGPVVESAFAYGLLGRGVSAPFARWRSQVGERLTQWPLPLSGGSAAPGLDGLLDLIERSARSVSTEAPAARTAPGPLLHPAAGDLSLVWRAAVAPYWEQLLHYLEAECEARGRVLMAGGVELLLATLHSKITWRSPVLEIADGPDEDVSLDGRGLVLAPSVFLAHRPGRITRRRAENGPVVLAFAAPPDTHQAAGLWDEPDDSGQSLGALVGQTRAAALHALRSSCTTSQLADRLGISAAGASQHTAVLRRAGLITTRRIRNMVLHTLTPLGVALLKGMSPRPAAPTAVRVPARRRAAGAVVRHRDPHPVVDLTARTTPAA